MDNQKDNCIRIHQNGFVHHDFDLNGDQIGFDFGIKFTDNPDSYGPHDTGEPYISLYVSFFKMNPRIDGSIEYSLPRSKWIHEVKPSKKDRESLFTLAVMQLNKDIQKIIAEKSFEKPTKPTFL